MFSVIDMMLFCETHLCVLQITTLANKQRESERFLSGVKQQLVLAQRDLLDQLVWNAVTRVISHEILYLQLDIVATSANAQN